MEERSTLQAPLLGGQGSSNNGKAQKNASGGHSVEMQNVVANNSNGYYPVMSNDPNAGQNLQSIPTNNGQVNYPSATSNQYQSQTQSQANQVYQPQTNNTINQTNRVLNTAPYNGMNSQTNAVSGTTTVAAVLPVGHKAINCGSCGTMLAYQEGAYCVACPCCKSTTAVVALSKVGCGRCGKVLLYPAGSNMVQCVCGVVNSTVPSVQTSYNSQGYNQNFAGQQQGYNAQGYNNYQGYVNQG
mmetsp:Transcript_49857/g.57212  ORF Transcript_49857/g.57212 Transcript_49857/m.57212 type:complete len:242 (+) Transcript_49857:66-791(+)